MIFKALSGSLLTRALAVSALAAFAAGAVAAPSARAQNTAPPPAANADATTQAADSIGAVIAQNASTPKKICGAITPIVYSTPASASEVIDQAQAAPELLEPLCECLSKTQTALKSTDPEGAKVVAKAVSEASPAFQACYAVALAPGESQNVAAAPAPASGGGGAGSSGPGGAPYSPGGSSGSSGFGGGPVSPN